MELEIDIPNKVYLSSLTEDDIKKDVRKSITLLKSLDVPLISFFGSARIGEEDVQYQRARVLARQLGKEGYGILTGGGTGIMKAASTGAHDAGAISIGIRAQVLADEHITDNIFTHRIDVKFLLVRRFALSVRSHAYVFFPGGLGTLNEIFEYVMLIQMELYEKVPCIFVGSDFYRPLIRWLRDAHVRENLISSQDIDHFFVSDSIEDIIHIIKNFTQNRSSTKIELSKWKYHQKKKAMNSACSK